MTEVQHIPAQTLRENCTRRFSSFCHLLQDEGWMDPIHEKLCDWIQYHIEQAFPPGTDLSDPNLTKTLKLAIIMPRGSLKTTFCNRNFSAWLPVYFGTEIRSLMVTNTHPNAKKKMNAIRDIFTSNEQFKAVFPELHPETKDKWNSEIAILPRKGNYEDGTFESAGVGTAKTGSHYNIIIEDDTLAPDADEMGEDLTLPSHESMERAIGYHNAANPLLVPKGIRIRVVVSTRWGEGDLIDHLQSKDTGWKFFNMPALNSQGEPVFSMFYTKETLKEIEADIGPFMFSCLYLNQPQDPRAKTFKPDQIARATHELPPLHEMDYLTLAIDPAISKDAGACDTGISLAGHRKVGAFPHIYFYEVLAGKFSMGETIDEAIRIIKKAGPELFRSYKIENIAYQQALLERFSDVLRQEGLPVRVSPFNSRTNKNDRIRNTLEPLFYSGRIHLSPDLPKATFTQLDHFPNGKFVDIIDCMSFHIKEMGHADRYEKEERPEEQVPPNSWDLIMQEIEEKNKSKETSLRRSRAYDPSESLPVSITHGRSGVRRTQTRFASSY
jgi:hypothetical protein